MRAVIKLVMVTAMLYNARTSVRTHATPQYAHIVWIGHTLVGACLCKCTNACEHVCMMLTCSCGNMGTHAQDANMFLWEHVNTCTGC